MHVGYAYVCTLRSNLTFQLYLQGNNIFHSLFSRGERNLYEVISNRLSMSYTNRTALLFTLILLILIEYMDFIIFFSQNTYPITKTPSLHWFWVTKRKEGSRNAHNYGDVFELKQKREFDFIAFNIGYFKMIKMYEFSMFPIHHEKKKKVLTCSIQLINIGSWIDWQNVDKETYETWHLFQFGKRCLLHLFVFVFVFLDPRFVFRFPWIHFLNATPV